MIEILKFALILCVAYASSHYSLSTVWKNATGCCIVAAVFAVLVAVFLWPVF